jgi:SIR2-like domain
MPLRPEVVAKIKKGECVLFLGAAVHAPPPADSPFAYPDEKRPMLAGELTALLAEDSKFCQEFPASEYPSEYPLNLQRVALWADMPDGGGRAHLIDKLVEVLETGKEPSPALLALARLPFRVIVTTNYDSLTEQALRAATVPLRHVKKKPRVLVYEPKFDSKAQVILDEPSEEQPLLFYIHGNLERRDNIVVTAEDYIKFIGRMTQKDQFHPIPQWIRTRIQQWPTLFVGYSLRDYNLRLLFQTLRWGLDESLVPRSTSVDRLPDRLVRHYLEKEEQTVFFVVEDIWNFVPELYRSVCGEEMDASLAAP